MTSITIKSEDEMAKFAQDLAKNCQKGDIFALKGSLGVGKSFLARHFINALSITKQNVPSPTFNLVYSYDSKKGAIFHFDLYRLKSADELENIGFFEALQEGICLIEWPEIAEEFLPKNHTTISIKNSSNNRAELREVTILTHLKTQ